MLTLEELKAGAHAIDDRHTDTLERLLEGSVKPLDLLTEDLVWTGVSDEAEARKIVKWFYDAGQGEMLAGIVLTLHTLTHGHDPRRSEKGGENDG